MRVDRVIHVFKLLRSYRTTHTSRIHIVIAARSSRTHLGLARLGGIAVRIFELVIFFQELSNLGRRFGGGLLEELAQVALGFCNVQRVA